MHIFSRPYEKPPPQSSVPGALALLVWRYASCSKASSIRGARVRNTRLGSWAACAARRWSVGVTGGEIKGAPVALSRATGCPASPSLPGGPWALGPHRPRYYAPLRLPCCPSRDPARVTRAPLPCLLRCGRGIPPGLVVWAKPPGRARAVGRPVPLAGKVPRRPLALPRSRVTPVDVCPAFRPRGCPAPSPYRAQACCLPATGHRRRSPRVRLEGSPFVHDSTHCGAPSHALHPCAFQLRTPIAGGARVGHS
jgi:hypothetical protein